MQLQVLEGITLEQILSDPEMQEEIVIAAIDVLTEASRQLREAKMVLTGRILAKMKADNATKMLFVGRDGEQKVATRTNGSMGCSNKYADEAYKAAGFDPLEIGKYVFEPSWTKAKEARKVGGLKQQTIDSLFQAESEYIKIAESKTKGIK